MHIFGKVQYYGIIPFFFFFSTSNFCYAILNATPYNITLTVNDFLENYNIIEIFLLFLFFLRVTFATQF